ncbi:hypothetical protein GEX75_20740 [Salmonella enterica]|nr:hypothetical protein [Salmonella enterica subsp. enterica serovar Mississippi]EDJ0867623.1 hypothetical protein [Salmonella enterica]EDJ4889470.1 hypothetical protein [Salmonella enterica]EDJ4943375.1 hypothetical protein [Salmonella enterica]EDJ4966157.1 hypothetical protein [Salmonella enterica]
MSADAALADAFPAFVVAVPALLSADAADEAACVADASAAPAAFTSAAPAAFTAAVALSDA